MNLLPAQPKAGFFPIETQSDKKNNSSGSIFLAMQTSFEDQKEIFFFWFIEHNFVFKCVSKCHAIALDILKKKDIPMPFL